MFFNAISCPISSSPASQTFAKHSSDAISSFCEYKQAPHASFRAPSISCNFILVSDELRYRAISQSNGDESPSMSAPSSCSARAAFRPNIMASSYNRTASSSLPADATPAASALMSRASRRDCCQRAMLGSSGDEPANKTAVTAAAERGVPNRFMAAIWAMAFQLLPPTRPTATLAPWPAGRLWQSEPLPRSRASAFFLTLQHLQICPVRMTRQNFNGLERKMDCLNSHNCQSRGITSW